MQLSDIITGVNDWGYDTDTDAVKTRFINRVYKKVTGAERWPFLEKQNSALTTVAGTSAYALPMTDWRNLDGVRLDQTGTTPPGIPMKYRAPQAFRDDEHLDRDQSTPFYWSFFNQQLHLYPNPDGVYTVIIDYIYEPPDLANPGDVPVIPEPYHEILIVGTVKRMAHRNRDWVGEMQAEQEYEDLYRKMLDEYLVRQRQTSSHVESSGFWNTQIPYPFIRDGF